MLTLIFRAQRAAILRELDTITPTKAIEGKDYLDLIGSVIPNLNAWLDQMVLAVKPILNGYAEEAAHRLWARLLGGGGKPPDRGNNNVGPIRPDDDNPPPGSLGISFDLVPPKLREAVDRLALQFCEETNATTSLHLRDALSRLRAELYQGLVEGETLPEVRRRVEAVFDHAERWRAERIARTESSRIVHSAEIIAAKETGLIKAKKWLASGDACEACAELAKMPPIDLDVPFYVHGSGKWEYRNVMHPPLHPHCMCSETLIVNDDALAPGVDLSDTEGLIRWAEGQL